MRKEFKLTEEQFDFLMDACKPVPYIIIGGIPPASAHENAMRAWNSLGGSIGFIGDTARPINGKDTHFFTAEPT